MRFPWTGAWPPGWTAWDARAAGRAAGGAIGSVVLACLVTGATDEGGVPWSERLARTMPLGPLCAAVGVAAGLLPAVWRGEVRALLSLGRSPAQVAAGAVAGGSLVGLFLSLLIGLSRGVDVAGFYPVAPHAPAWRWDGAAFVNGAAGLRVAIDGLPSRGPPELGAAMTGLPPYARLSAALTTALAALALSWLVAHGLLSGSPGVRAPRQRRVDIAASALAIALSIVFFQAAAARQLPAPLAVLPAAALLGHALGRYRAAP